MLKPLHPGIQPLGIFDIEDNDIALVRGGEVGIFESLDYTTDAYAADVFQKGPQVHVSLDKVSAAGKLYGLVDEGTSVAGESSYGTMFGSIIGGTVGICTGFGTLATTGVTIVGPSTITGSGKVTLWSKPGLYGVTRHGWYDATQYTAGHALNVALYGVTADATNDGKLTTSATSNGVAVGVGVGAVSDASLVSTTNAAAGASAGTDEYNSIYLAGMQF